MTFIMARNSIMLALVLMLAYTARSALAFTMPCMRGDHSAYTLASKSSKHGRVVVSELPRRRTPSSRALLMRIQWNAAENYYQTLGLTPTATPADIKRAYRKLALRTHPDVNKEQGAAEKFKKVCQAYKVLSDEKLRRQYDMARSGRGGGYTGSGSRAWAGSRASSSSTASSSSSSSGGRQWYEGYDGGKASTDTSEYATDDSFTKIFSDFLDTLGSRGGKGVLDDLVEYLESQVDGVTQDEFEALLRSGGRSEIQEELDNLHLLVPKLREKLEQSKTELLVAQSELKSLGLTDLGGRDMGTKVDKRLELVEKTASLSARCRELEANIKRAEKRVRRLSSRVEDLKGGPMGPDRGTTGEQASSSSSYRYSSRGSGQGGQSSSNSGGGATSGSGSSSRQQSRVPWDPVEAELQRLKKEMNLGE